MDERHSGSDFENLLMDDGGFDNSEAIDKARLASGSEELQEAIEAAENGSAELGLALWRELASYREAGLDLCEVPAELVAWFDRRLEELTDVPAFTRMGSRVMAREAARLATPPTQKEVLEALCLKYEDPPSDEQRRRKSERKNIADWFLAREGAEEIAALWDSERRCSLSAACRPVAQRHGISTRTVKRAVKEAGIPFKQRTEEFHEKADAAAFCRDLQKRGYRRVSSPGDPVAPGTFKPVAAGDRFIVRYF